MEVIQNNGVSKIRIDSIVMDDALMFREKLDEGWIRQLQERYENGFGVDPIKVCEVKGKGRLLIDGFHRLTAAKRAGLKELNVIYTYGTYEDAKWMAAFANLRHGKQLTRKEKRKVVILYLKRYPERSDRWIAEDVGIDHKTAREIREELESVGEIPQLNEFVGKDGKRYPRTRKHSSRSGEKSENQESKVELKVSDLNEDNPDELAQRAKGILDYAEKHGEVI